MTVRRGVARALRWLASRLDPSAVPPPAAMWWVDTPNTSSNTYKNLTVRYTYPGE